MKTKDGLDYVEGMSRGARCQSLRRERARHRGGMAA